MCEYYTAYSTTDVSYIIDMGRDYRPDAGPSPPL